MEAKMQLNDTVNVLKEKTIKEELYVQQNYTLKIKERLPVRMAAIQKSASNKYHKKLVQTVWIRTTEIYCLTVLESVSPKSWS